MKSPVASLTLTCSSVKNRVRVTILVLIASSTPLLPLEDTWLDILAVRSRLIPPRKDTSIRAQEAIDA